MSLEQCGRGTGNQNPGPRWFAKRTTDGSEEALCVKVLAGDGDGVDEDACAGVGAAHSYP